VIRFLWFPGETGYDFTWRGEDASLRRGGRKRFGRKGSSVVERGRKGQSTDGRAGNLFVIDCKKRVRG